MNKIRFAAVALCALALGLASPALATPTITNVQAHQRTDGSGYVDISYDMADPDAATAYVTLMVSSDGGATYTITPSPSALTGNVGFGVPRGTGLTIVWDSRVDLAGVKGGNYKVQVTADDGYGLGGGGGAVGTMVYVPAGSFLMGNSGAGDDSYYGYYYGYSDEFPQHSVYLSGYWIGKYDVTRGEYRQFMNAGGYFNPAYWSADGWAWRTTYGVIQPYYWDPVQNWGTGNFTQTDSFPVVGVTYYEAEAYCNWAGGHLPTEAQWEKAARWDGHPRIYPWGDTWDAEKCNNYYDTNPAGGGYGAYQTSPVGSYPAGASPYGCEDMAGNVWQWCQDWYDPNYYSETPAGGWVNPQGPSTSPYGSRVLRGGGWYNNVYSGNNFRCAGRGYFDYPVDDSYGLGFRLAR